MMRPETAPRTAPSGPVDRFAKGGKAVCCRMNPDGRSSGGIDLAVTEVITMPRKSQEDQKPSAESDRSERSGQRRHRSARILPKHHAGRSAKRRCHHRRRSQDRLKANSKSLKACVRTAVTCRPYFVTNPEQDVCRKNSPPPKTSTSFFP